MKFAGGQRGGNGFPRVPRPSVLSGNSEIKTATDPGMFMIAAFAKAVLKHTQSKRWREIWCGFTNAERLDCVRFIAAFPAGALPPQLPPQSPG